MVGYDTLYQKWLQAKRDKNFSLADEIRERFEYFHGLTIFAEGEMPVIGITVMQMKESVWQKRYGNPKVGEIIATQDSKYRTTLPAIGAVYRGLV